MPRRRTASTFVVAVLAVTIVVGGPPPQAGATEGSMTTAPTAAGTSINAFTAGPDGLTTWFTSFGSDEIGRITLSTGAVARFAIPPDAVTGECGPADITVTALSEIWFTCLSNGEIGSVDLSGPTPTPFTANVPDQHGLHVALPRGIASDADGNVWFTSEGTNVIGKVDPVNFTTQLFDVSGGGAGCVGPAQITAGHTDMWFTCNSSSTIGRIGGSLGLVTYGDADGDIDRPWSIVRRSSTLWFTNVEGNSIGFFGETSAACCIQSLSDPMGNIDRPFGLTTNGPELWFTSQGNDRIGRVSTTPLGFQVAMFEDPTGVLNAPSAIVWSYDQQATFVGDDDRIRHLPRSGFGPHGFTDVPANAFYEDGLRWATYHQIVTGFANHQYRPTDPVNRGQVVNMLWTMMDRPAVATPHGFVDVPANAFYEPALRWARSLGLVNGFPGNLYKPADPVNRGQIVNMLWKLTGQLPGDPHGFSDVPANAFYADALDWAKTRQLVNGFPGNLYKPADPVNRGQIVNMLRNLVADWASWVAVSAPQTALIT